MLSRVACTCASFGLEFCQHIANWFNCRVLYVERSAAHACELGRKGQISFRQTKRCTARSRAAYAGNLFKVATMQRGA